MPATEQGPPGESGPRGPAGADGPRGPAGVDADLDTPERDALRVATLTLLALVVIVVAAMVWFLLTYVQAQRETNRCYQQLTGDIRAWIDGAVDPGRQDRQAQRELLTRPRSDDPRVELLHVAAQRGLLDAADAARARNPIPDRRCA